MAPTSSQLGSCPYCGSELTRGAVLIEYDVGDETRQFAECDECEAPVQPQ